ncbi:CaiB/BaiF CoA transferase family protein [Nocardioides sp. NPDC057577]|uniref:CaiB/BaiF CoA transferase family protein n=1 Tax=Nocardioides sp. NPDC057577 TaxID=3346171 RepID=UPI00367285BA
MTSDARHGAGPLAGIRVLELGSFIAGPFAGQLLGDYGAEVVKVEAPVGGDPMRTWGVVHEGESLWWPSLARNKASVAIDLRTDEGRALVRRIAAEVDVVLENFRPGTLARWGLDYKSLAEVNPKLVVVHVSGFGQTGPRAADAGFGSIGEAMGGIRHTTGEPDRAPSRAGISLGDSLAAMFAVIGTMGALVERARSGRGQEVDVAIYEAVAALMESTMADHEVGGRTRGRTGSVLPGVAPSNAYPTRDGSEVLIAANADTVFGRLCKAMDKVELATDERYASHAARGANMVELDDLIGAWTTGLDAEALLALLEEHGVPAGRVYTAPDMLADPHYRARDMVLRLATAAGGEVPAAGVVPKFSRTPGGVRASGPRIGEHSRQLLAELAGVDDTEWSQLADAGVVR